MKIYHPHKHHRFLPIALVSFGLPAVIVGVFLLYANLFIQDEAIPNDADLRLSEVIIPVADNAYTNIKQATKSFETIDLSLPYRDEKVDAMLEGKAWDAEYVKNILLKYALPLAQLHEAANKLVYQDEFGASPDSADFNNFPSLTGIQFLARLSALRAEQAAREKNIPLALERNLEVIRIGHLMEKSQATVISYLVGGAIKKIGLEGIRQTALRYPITQLQSKSLAVELDKYRDPREGAVKAMKLEYAGARKTLTTYTKVGDLYDLYNITVVGYQLSNRYYALSSDVDFDQSSTRSANLTSTITQDSNGKTIKIQQSLLSRALTMLDDAGVFHYYYMPHQTLRYAAEEARRRIAYTQESCDQIDESSPMKIYSTAHGVQRFFEPNAIGRVLADIGRLSLSGLNTRRCEGDLYISVAQLTLSAKAYISTHAAHPNALSEIIQYGQDVESQDPFSGTSFLYSAEKKSIISVGPDHTGQSNDGMKKEQSDDYEFTLP